MVLTRQASILARRNQENASNPHHNTPKKARIRAAYKEWLETTPSEETRTTITKQAFFERNHISRRSGYRILGLELTNPSDRTFHNQPGVTETRGRRKLIIDDDLHRMEEILYNSDIETRSMTWETLAFEAGLDVSVDIIRRAIGALNYHKCIACRKGWVNKELGERRKAWAKTMLDRYPDLEDWKRVRFSDEVHFSLGP
jgi:hypothetical protein